MGTSQWGGGEAESIHRKAEERIAKVCHKIQRTSSDNNGKEPSRADAQPLCEGEITRPRMMTMLQAFKLTLSCQNSRTDH